MPSPPDDFDQTDPTGPLKLTFRPLKSNAPAASRYRLLLKIALRQLGLKCTFIESAADPKGPSQ
jgi:hypothetical protein